MAETALLPAFLKNLVALQSCRAADYTPEWRLKEERKKEKAAKKTPPSDVSGREPPAPPKQPAAEDEPDPSLGVEHQLNDHGQGLGKVELGADGVVGGNDKDEKSPPGR